MREINPRKEAISVLKTVIRGNAYTAKNNQTVTFLPAALVEIDQAGTITAVFPAGDPAYQSHLTAARQGGILREMASDQVLLPGFVDLHVHAPQWPQAGLALDKPLEEWLNDYTFPLEAKYADLAFAKRVYHNLVTTLLANGTTTVLFFGTIHRQANLVLARECLTQGLRSLIGKVAMDNPDQTPAYYRDPSPQAAIEETERFINDLQELGAGRPLAPIPVITPRFVPSCTDESLAGLGRLAAKYHLPVQTHVSESRWEHQYAIDRFGHHDAAVLDHFGLLTAQTILAHGTQLTEEDAALLRNRHSALAHCPLSNAYFGNGVLPVKQLLARGNQIGLGTDISGGYSPSLYDNIRQTVASSRMREDGISRTDNGVADSRISVQTAFYLATKGGAAALNLPVGEIAPGKQADLQVVTDQLNWPGEEPLDRLERLLYQTHRAQVAATLVNGRVVAGNLTQK